MSMADKKKNKISIKNVVACGIGTALFVVLTEVQNLLTMVSKQVK